MKKNICVALTNRTNYSKLKTVLFALRKLPDVPVSYTHLDVYKRQTEYWLLSYAALERILPVSYTHLDVYKRQDPALGRTGRGFRGATC